MQNNNSKFISIFAKVNIVKDTNSVTGKNKSNCEKKAGKIASQEPAKKIAHILLGIEADLRPLEQFPLT